PALIVTEGPTIAIDAPLPFEIVIPTSLMLISAPVVVFSRIPPVGPGTSEIISVFCACVCTTTFGIPGGAASASAGTSATLPNQQPLQIGWSGSPCSNSTHTPAPICGSAQAPICLPANGKQGMAQLIGEAPCASATWQSSRPCCIGSTLLRTVPRYLP